MTRAIGHFARIRRPSRSLVLQPIPRLFQRVILPARSYIFLTLHSLSRFARWSPESVRGLGALPVFPNTTSRLLTFSGWPWPSRLAADEFFHYGLDCLAPCSNPPTRSVSVCTSRLTNKRCVDANPQVNPSPLLRKCWSVLHALCVCIWETWCTHASAISSVDQTRS